MPQRDNARAHRHLPTPEDAVAQAIRVADGQHNLGAGALGEVAVKALRDAGYTLMMPVCEACDDDWG